MAWNRLISVQLQSKSKKYLEAYFKKEIKPLISPLIIDKKTPFPFLNNKQIYCALQIQSKSNIKIGIIPASGQFNRVILLNGGKRFILAEDLILHYAPNVFKNYKIIDKTLFRITRNADITVEEGLYDHDLDFREVMEELCKKKKNFIRYVFSYLKLSVSPHWNSYAKSLN